MGLLLSIQFTRKAAQPGEMWMIRTYVLLVPSHPVRLVADLVEFDLNDLVIGIVDLVARRGVLCTHSSHKRTCVCGHYGKKVKKSVRQNEQL